MSRNDGVNRPNKLIEITYHYVHDAVARKEVTLEYILTNDMIAEILTKPILRLAFLKFIYLAGLQANRDKYNN